MHDTTLLRIAITTSILCTILLFIIMQTARLEDTPFNRLEDRDPGEKVRISGTIEQVRQSEKATFIELSQTCRTTAVVFDDLDAVPEKGTPVEILGSYQEYNGKTEVVVEEMTEKG